jgi:hypothetical protein
MGIYRSVSGPKGTYKLHVYGGQNLHQIIGVKMIVLLCKNDTIVNY